MPGLVALAALDTLSGTRFRTILGVMALLLAVLTSEGVDPLLGAVTSSMAGLLTVHTLDFRLDLPLNLFLLAVLPEVSKDYSGTTSD